MSSQSVLDGKEESYSSSILTSSNQPHTTACNITSNRLTLGLKEFANLTVKSMHGVVQICSGLLVKVQFSKWKMDTMKQILMLLCLMRKKAVKVRKSNSLTLRNSALLVKEIMQNLLGRL